MGEPAANFCRTSGLLGPASSGEKGALSTRAPHLQHICAPTEGPGCSLLSTPPALCICCLLKEGFYSSKREGIDAFFFTFSQGTCVVEAAAVRG